MEVKLSKREVYQIKLDENSYEVVLKNGEFESIADKEDVDAFDPMIDFEDIKHYKQLFDYIIKLVEGGRA